VRRLRHLPRRGLDRLRRGGFRDLRQGDLGRLGFLLLHLGRDWRGRLLGYRTRLASRLRDDGLCHRLGVLRLTGPRRGLRLCWGGWGGSSACVGLRRARLGVCVPQPAGHWRLHGRGRRFHELAKLLQLRENVLAGNSELLRELVYSGLACHCSPRPSEAGGIDPRDLVLSSDVHGFSFTADS
jgi:hypothetical protein